MFLNLSASAHVRLVDQLGDLPGKFAAWRMQELWQRGPASSSDVAANWKLIIQNYSECLHCPTIHPALQKVSHYLSGTNDPAGPESTYLGGRMDPPRRHRHHVLHRRGPPREPAGPGRRRLPACSSYYAVLPNLLLSLHPDYVMTHVLWPRGEGRTDIVCEWLFHPDEPAKPGFESSDGQARVPGRHQPARLARL